MLDPSSSPFRFEILPDRRRIEVTASGRASYELGRESIAKVKDDPDFDPDFALLVDLREIDYLPSAPEAEGFAELMSVFHGRIALVATETVSFGLARMVSEHSQLRGLEVKAFRDVEEARTWVEERREPTGES